LGLFLYLDKKCRYGIMVVMTYKNIFIGLAILVVLGVGFLMLSSKSEAPTAEPETKTEDSQEIATTSVDATDVTNTDKTQANANIAVEQSEVITSDSAPAKFTESRLSVVPIGPRETALTPEDAFRFLMEAMRARDFERAVSHMHPTVREQYTTVFETEYTTKDHPIMARYYNGVVSEPKLSQPQHNIYEIKTTMRSGSAAFNSYVIYEDSLGEYFVLEL